MTALTQVTDYLTNKVNKTNDANPKANTGAVLIKTHKDWRDKVEKIVMIAFQTIQQQFARDNTSYPAGEAALTNLSMTISKRVAPVIKREPLKDLRHQVALGDIMIEGFVYHGFVELVQPTRRTEGYIIRVAPKWEQLGDMPVAKMKDLIAGSVKEPPAYPTADIHKMHANLFNKEGAYVKALHNLQQVKWRINSRVLDTVIANRKKFVNENQIEDNDAKEQRRRSKLIDWKFTIGKAEVLKDWDGFYQNYDVDYRGRMYCKEPFLNYQGNDLAKGMLTFDEVKPIDEDGLFWLAVHTACAFNQSYHKDEIPEWCEEDYKSYLEEEGLEDISVDKMTPNDRASWTQEHMLEILGWSENDVIQFKAEKPVLFLACCYEWSYVQETGMTCLPVAIDGSNNGWQHLGAISKDNQTGELVGLTPVGIQKDFYVQTAKQLIELARKDERLTSILNSMPMKHIRKGITKRGSMTRAYSAGASKIAENMYFDCKTSDYHELYGITIKDCYKLSKLLVKAIEKVCPGPLQTMGYLQALAAYQIGKYDVAGDKTEYKSLKKERKELLSIEDPDEDQINLLNHISKKLKEEYTFELSYGNGETSIFWSTPSGFNAMYEKYTMTNFKARAKLNGKTIKHVLRVPTERPDIRGYMCGISPNYIHSMDAAHMALVIAQWDGAFGAVHDSFSTHASDVEKLVSITKSVFIEMYDKENYFDVIREQITGNTDNIEQPTLGSLEIGRIRDSDYFFI